MIFRITNSYPPHPAGSFYYPELDSLPTIATFSFIKEKEFELSEVFHLEKDSHGDDFVAFDNVNKYAYHPVDEDGTTAAEDEQGTSIVTFLPKDNSADKVQRLSLIVI